MRDLDRELYNRRYINRRESIAYVLFDSSKSFHINAYQTRFIIDVLKIDLAWNSVISLINGVWDVINDSFLGALVDKTATRWGKFRPYLLAYAVPGTILTCLYWLSPLLFDKNPVDMKKIVFWLLLAMTQETIGTLRSISETGLLANITPNPNDRVRLYTNAEVISALWESTPQIVMGLLIDLVNHKMINATMDSIYMGMGTLCAVSGGLLGIFFVFFSKERIAQTRQHYSYAAGLKSLARNRPVLLIIFSDILSGISAGEWDRNYFIDVLGSESLRNVISIPGAPLSFVSYAYINAVRAHFSIKSLWIFGQHLKDVLAIFIFIIGSLRGVGPQGIYQKRWVMVGLLMLRDIAYKGTLSINKIPPKEILTDALDYCEWKNGFRSEGITLTTKSMVTKMFRNVINSFNTALMKKAGYSINAGFGQQTEKTKYILFAMSTVFASSIDLFSIIPKLFYDLSGDRRKRMYEDLAVSRAQQSREYAQSLRETEQSAPLAYTQED
ncbi:MAG: MFS transporter [Oscillospiraceae bacterium]|jgi:Na+/melibiose symporter-like transporter|nr:MFS transporter [Oscillospiraceae bacterium]